MLHKMLSMLYNVLHIFFSYYLLDIFHEKIVDTSFFYFCHIPLSPLDPDLDGKYLTELKRTELGGVLLLLLFYF